MLNTGAVGAGDAAASPSKLFGGKIDYVSANLDKFGRNFGKSD